MQYTALKWWQLVSPQQGCAMTVWWYSPSKYRLTVDAVNDGVKPSSRSLGTIMTVWLTVRTKNRKRPKKGILTPKWPFRLFSPHFCMCVIYTNNQIIINWCNNERKRKGKGWQKVCVLTRIQTLVSTFHSRKALNGFTQYLRWTVPSTVWTIDTVISETPNTDVLTVWCHCTALILMLVTENEENL
jgi:hypothetical protein